MERTYISYYLLLFVIKIATLIKYFELILKYNYYALKWPEIVKGRTMCFSAISCNSLPPRLDKVDMLPL
jgi:hypothetical protein